MDRTCQTCGYMKVEITQKEIKNFFRTKTLRFEESTLIECMRFGVCGVDIYLAREPYSITTEMRTNDIRGVCGVAGKYWRKKEEDKNQQKRKKPRFG